VRVWSFERAYTRRARSKPASVRVCAAVCVINKAGQRPEVLAVLKAWRPARESRGFPRFATCCRRSEGVTLTTRERCTPSGRYTPGTYGDIRAHRRLEVGGSAGRDRHADER
jgi:hypothetical protein